MINEFGINEPKKANPLMGYARKPVLSVKLPTNGSWYDNDMIEYNALGEVEIMPMLPSDELMLLNPYELVSGNAIVEMIKSCCPSIKDPKKLYYPDVNVILLGIKKASYGDEIKQNGICPHCLAKMRETEHKVVTEYLIENYSNKTVGDNELHEAYRNCKSKVKEQVAQLERDNEIVSHSQEFIYSIDAFLETMTYLPKEKIIETRDGLKIYLTPYKFSDKVIIANQELKKEKFVGMLRSIDTQNVLTDDQQEEKGNEFRKAFGDLVAELNIVLTSCIKYIKTPNDEIVDDKEFIKEYIINTDPQVYTDILGGIEELNKCGITDTVDMECELCHTKWSDKFYGFNQSDFFGISS